jgi:Na+-transporting methylmalonyl-CoA/oxaloacetate decarboxylase gamma subunit
MIFVAMTTVFAGLTALVGLIAVAARMLGRFQPETSKPSIAPAEAAPLPDLVGLSGVDAQCEASEQELLRVALAAVSVHRMRNANRVPAARPSTWVSAGRKQQIAPFFR